MPEKKAFTCVLNTPNLIFVPKSLKIEHPPPPLPLNTRKEKRQNGKEKKINV